LIKYDIPEGDLDELTDPTERLVRILSKGGATKDPLLAPAAKAALGMWSAAHARGRLPKTPNKKVPDAATGAAAPSGSPPKTEEKTKTTSPTNDDYY